MPRSAIMTGAVDLVLPIDKMPEALARFARRSASTAPAADTATAVTTDDWLPEIIALLRMPKPSMISRFTRKARCGAGSSGGW